MREVPIWAIKAGLGASAGMGTERKVAVVGAWKTGQGAVDESEQVLNEVYERIQAYPAFRPRSLKGSDSLFATTACYDRDGSVVTAESKRAVFARHHLILIEGPLLAGVKKPGIVVNSLRYSTLIFALLNDANPTRVQKMMRHQHPL